MSPHSTGSGHLLGGVPFPNRVSQASVFEPHAKNACLAMGGTKAARAVRSSNPRIPWTSGGGGDPLLLEQDAATRANRANAAAPTCQGVRRWGAILAGSLFGRSFAFQVSLPWTSTVSETASRRTRRPHPQGRGRSVPRANE